MGNNLQIEWKLEKGSANQKEVSSEHLRYLYLFSSTTMLICDFYYLFDLLIILFVSSFIFLDVAL